MRKILLTSAGFENTRIGKVFLELAAKKPGEIKALFIPTAAIDADAIAVLPKCMNDLLNVGIPAKNITVFDLHCGMPYEELCKYDAVYFCGGNPGYLLNRINDTRFCEALKRFVDNGGVYVGVSAGSCVATKDLPGSLEFVNCTLSVHVPKGSAVGAIDASTCPHISLTDNQAILIRGGDCFLIE